jgi:hypothetical protein
VRRARSIHAPPLALLGSDGETSRHDMATACVAGDAEHVADVLAASPGASREAVGPFGWEPILYATSSRLPRADPARAEGRAAVAGAHRAASARGSSAG